MGASTKTKDNDWRKQKLGVDRRAGDWGECDDAREHGVEGKMGGGGRENRKQGDSY